MSAAERLKALEAHIEDVRLLPRERQEKMAALAIALPEIIAVVEAAENRDLSNIFDDTKMYPAQKRLRAAVAALDEALGEQA